MLKTRVITAAILLALLLPILFFMPALTWAGVTLLLLATGGWEWARMVKLKQPLLLAALILVLGLACLGLRQTGVWSVTTSTVIYALATIFWLLVAPLWMKRKRDLLRWYAMAPFVLLSAWLALVEARAQGIAFMLTLMLLVWLADIGAYFAGKRFGKHKLAPAISPGKTWEGVAGGLLAGLALSLWLGLSAAGVDSYFGHLAPRLGPAGLILAVVMLVALSIVGDLFESLLKRQAGVKDSSGLLPGHGGVLDRIDALLPVLPVAMLLYLTSVAG